MPQNEREFIEDRLYELFSLATGNRSPNGYPAGEEPQRASYMLERQWVDILSMFSLTEAGMFGPDRSMQYRREIYADVKGWSYMEGWS